MAQGRNAWDRAGAREIRDTESGETVLTGDMISATEKVQSGQVGGSGGGSGGTAITTTQNASPQNAPDGSTTEFTFSHDHPESPDSVVPIPRSRAMAGLPWLVGSNSDTVTVGVSAAPSADASIRADLVCVSGPGPTGPVDVTGFETGTVDSLLTGDLEFYSIGDGSAIDGSRSLRLGNTTSSKMAFTVGSYDGRDRTYRMAVDGTSFQCYPEVGVFASGSSYGDRSGYFAELDYPQGGSAVSLDLRVREGGSATKTLVEGLTFDDPGYAIIEIEPLSDGTVTVRVIDPDGGTVLTEGSGSDSSLSTGSIALGGNPNSTDVSIKYDLVSIGDV